MKRLSGVRKLRLDRSLVAGGSVRYATRMANDDPPEALPEVQPEAELEDPKRARLTTFFGWLAGGSSGLLLVYVLYLIVGDTLPIGPVTFVLFLAGAFGGMALADRLGPGGFRPLGLAAGVSLVAFLTIVAAVLLSR